MGVLRGLAAAALVGLAGVLCLLGALVAALALVLTVYWDERVVVLSILTALFVAGGALAILYARARARDSVRLAVLAAAGEIAYWSMRLLVRR